MSTTIGVAYSFLFFEVFVRKECAIQGLKDSRVSALGFGVPQCFTAAQNQLTKCFRNFYQNSSPCLQTNTNILYIYIYMYIYMYIYIYITHLHI